MPRAQERVSAAGFVVGERSSGPVTLETSARSFDCIELRLISLRMTGGAGSTIALLRALDHSFGDRFGGSFSLRVDISGREPCCGAGGKHPSQDFFSAFLAEGSGFVSFLSSFFSSFLPLDSPFEGAAVPEDFFA